jgi:hypothetical protein
MRLSYLLLLAPIVLSGCGHGGDGEESPTAKHEWSLLQSVEYHYRASKIEKIEVRKEVDRWLICVPAVPGRSRIWVMMDPQSAPYYKQLPVGNYSLTEVELREIRKATNPTTTVYECLRSHLHE